MPGSTGRFPQETAVQCPFEICKSSTAEGLNVHTAFTQGIEVATFKLQFHKLPRSSSVHPLLWRLARKPTTVASKKQLFKPKEQARTALLCFIITNVHPARQNA